MDNLVEVLELRSVLTWDRFINERTGKRELVEHGLVAARISPVAPFLILEFSSCQYNILFLTYIYKKNLNETRLYLPFSR